VALNEVSKKSLFVKSLLVQDRYIETFVLYHLSNTNTILLPVLLFTQTSGGHTMFYIMKIMYTMQ